MKILDMLGKACPIPVVEARRALEAGQEPAITVLVDNAVAVENLQKMAQGKGYAFSVVQQEAARYAVTLSREGAENAAPEPPFLAPATQRGPTVLITQNHMGGGSEELGKILIKGFLFTLTEWAVPPEAVYFLNSGVELVCEGANTLDDLRTLTENGTTIHACGTCLNFYALTDKLAVGQVVNMLDISTALANAAHLVTL